MLSRSKQVSFVLAVLILLACASVAYAVTSLVYTNWKMANGTVASKIHVYNANYDNFALHV